jgi:hypothetical protein
MSISSLSNLALDTTLNALSLLGLSTEQQTARRQRRKRRRQRERHLDDALVPLPSKRERSLTLPLSDEVQADIEKIKKQRAEPQAQSTLFSKLPLEIRMRIYATFFSHHKLSILKDERLRYVKWIPQDRHLLPLLLTCRRM